MKKIIFGALTLCLLLSACGQTAPKVMHNDTHTTTIPTTNVGTSPTLGESPLSIDTNGFVADSFEEYSEFVAQHKAEFPSYFVQFEQFSDWGSFYGFFYWPETTKESNNARFDYLFRTTDGRILSLTCAYEGADWFEAFYKPNEKSTDLSASYAGDLRKVSDQEKRFHFIKNGVCYNYSQGELSWIVWTHDGTRYALKVVHPSGAALSNIPVEQQAPFIRDLLHTDTVEMAMQTFEASMEAVAVK